MKEGLASPPLLVNLSGVPGLDAVATDAKGSLVIGATVTLAMLAENPVVIARARAVAQSAAHSATPQIRNQATVGGNLLQRPRCWYYRSADFHCRRKGGQTCFAHDGEHEYHAIFDNQLCAMVHPSSLAVALIAMEARLQLTTAKGRREAGLESFSLTPPQHLPAGYHLEDTELLTGIVIPPPPAGLVSAFVKVGQKESFDWPLADAAVAMQLQGGKCRRARVMLGAAAPGPRRAGAWGTRVGKPAQNCPTPNTAGPTAARRSAPLSR